MDLSNFPTNEMAKDIMAMVSPIYDEAYVAKWLFQVLGLAMQKPADIIKELADQEFPNTATWSLPYWEELYGVDTNTSLSDETRQGQLLAKRNFRKPMNPAKIEQVIYAQTGHKVTLTESISPYQISLEIDSAERRVNFQTIIDKVYELKQAQTPLVGISETTRFSVSRSIGFATVSVPTSISIIGG